MQVQPQPVIQQYEQPHPAVLLEQREYELGMARRRNQWLVVLVVALLLWHFAPSNALEQVIDSLQQVVARVLPSKIQPQPIILDQAKPELDGLDGLDGLKGLLPLLEKLEDLEQLEKLPK